MLVRYSPFRNLLTRHWSPPDFFSAEFDRDFFDMFRGLSDLRREEPTVQVAENKKNYLVRAEFPGFDKDDVKAEITDGVLCLTAEHKDEKWDQDEDEGWRSIETRTGKFHRCIPLPEDVDVEKISASMKKGVLRLTLPRAAEKAKEVKEIAIQQ